MRFAKKKNQKGTGDEQRSGDPSYVGNAKQKRTGRNEFLFTQLLVRQSLLSQIPERSIFQSLDHSLSRIQTPLVKKTYQTQNRPKDGDTN